MKHTTINPNTLPALGVDIGRVLMCPVRDDGRPDSSFLSGSDKAALAVPPSPLAFEVLTQLAECFAGRIWLVSKAGPRIEQLTRLWLKHHDFFRTVGLPSEHVRFCRQRSDKREHAKDLSLTHFIDDREDVLVHLRGLVPTLYLFGVQKTPTPPWAVAVRDWLEVSDHLMVPKGSGSIARHALGC
jgi:hypothetical protein